MGSNPKSIRKSGYKTYQVNIRKSGYEKTQEDKK